MSLGMYIGIAIGCIALLGVSSGIIYHKYHQDKQVKVNFEQQAQERLQQVADMNLPPFYIDHELDPVCIYEHELPPDVLPSVQPILVHSTSDEAMQIPPEEDPFFAHSSLPNNSNNQQFASAALISSATTVNSSGAPTEGYFDLTNMPTLPPPAAAVSSPHTTTPSSTFAASSFPTPRPINQEMLDLARVRAPPSYDIPNLVVDRSPLYHPSTHLFSPPSPSPHFTPYSEGSLHHQHQPGQDDYFGHVRLRAHTFSHPSSLQSPNQSFLQQLQQQVGHDRTNQQQSQGEEEEDLPATPRYSLEFSSDIPHEHHLEHHQRSRVLYDNSFLESSQSTYSFPLEAHSPASFSPSSSRTSWDYYDQDQGPSIRLHARTSSTSSLPGSHASSPLLVFETTTTPARTRGSSGGRRTRSSTLGESSRALMLRMHSLLRHSTSYSNSRDSTPTTSPSLAPADGYSSSASGLSAQGSGGGVPMVGLGLEYGGHVAPEPLQHDWAQDQNQEHTVFVIVDESEGGGDTTTATASNISSPPMTSSVPISLRAVPSTVSQSSTDEQESVSTSEVTVVVEEKAEEEEEEEEEDEDESVSKTQHQHAAPEPMQTIPMALAVS
ncbi:hypothetical protein BGZ96_009801 [Linnemannia gamsii]|uniref:Uncharacterized protein n=1 Tax=Linnemannia gamsii TaxID=64522 RepID=A0ABQ7JWE8_9FUNG|nr:hypothetical protein BGZ96_009801 [Linnemannia gamsii]